MNKRISLDEAYLTMAEVWSLRSYATRSQVGSLLVNPELKQIVSDGYNGMPSGMPNEDIEYLEDGVLVTNPLALHSESNAILKCAENPNSSTKGCTLYCVYSPCLECTKLIIQAKIKRVVYRIQYRNAQGIDILRQRGIEVVQLARSENDQNLIKNILGI